MQPHSQVLNFTFPYSIHLSSVADEDSGEIPVAFVVRKNGSSLSEETVIDYVARQVLLYFLILLCSLFQILPSILPLPQNC